MPAPLASGSSPTIERIDVCEDSRQTPVVRNSSHPEGARYVYRRRREQSGGPGHSAREPIAITDLGNVELIEPPIIP